MIEVHDNAEAHRYEAIDDGVLLGFATYRDAGPVRTMVHTETLPEFGGRGVGGALARAALDDIRARGLRVIPNCPFIASFMGRHPEYGDLLADQPG